MCWAYEGLILMRLAFSQRTDRYIDYIDTIESSMEIDFNGLHQDVV